MWIISMGLKNVEGLLVSSNMNETKYVYGILTSSRIFWSRAGAEENYVS